MNITAANTTTSLWNTWSWTLACVAVFMAFVVIFGIAMLARTNKDESTNTKGAQLDEEPVYTPATRKKFQLVGNTVHQTAKAIK